MHLFEFMDQSWLPAGLRETLRDILECGNSRPFRSYYEWAAKEALTLAKESRCHTIVELGAGTAPITRHLLKRDDLDGFHLMVCDINPDLNAFRSLEDRAPEIVEALAEPVDFSKARGWPANSLLVLSATLHHVPDDERQSVLEALQASGNPLLVIEPLRKTVSSILFTFLSVVPALLTPLRYWGRPGTMRRVLWCWILPLAPPMFIWDGIVSCLRQWSPRRWSQLAASHPSKRPQPSVRQHLFTQLVTLIAESGGAAAVRL